MTFGFDCCCGSDYCGYLLGEEAAGFRQARKWNVGRDPLWKQFFEVSLFCYVDQANASIHPFIVGDPFAYVGYHLFEQVSGDEDSVVCIRDRGDGLYAKYVFGDAGPVLSEACGLQTRNYYIKEVFITKGAYIANYRFIRGRMRRMANTNVLCPSCPPPGTFQESPILCRLEDFPASYALTFAIAEDPLCPPDPAYTGSGACGVGTPGSETLLAETVTTNGLTPLVRDGMVVSFGTTVGSWGGRSFSISGDRNLPVASSYAPGVRVKGIGTIELWPDDRYRNWEGAGLSQDVRILMYDCCNNHEGITIVGSAITIDHNAPAMGFESWIGDPNDTRNRCLGHKYYGPAPGGGTKGRCVGTYDVPYDTCKNLIYWPWSGYALRITGA